MEDAELTIIPTASKAKISHLLSYPTGAETVSRAVAEAPQFPLLRLQFHFWSDLHLRWGRYEFIRAEYRKDSTVAENYPLRALYPRTIQYQWEIVVQPVPRVYRRKIREYLEATALLQIKAWLIERTQISQEGSDIIAFFYSEKTEEFEVHTATKMSPSH